jgi:hypothetical protein
LPVDAEKFFVDLGFDTVERVYSALSAAPDEWQQNLKDLVNVSELLERIRRDWPQVVIKPVPVAKKDVVQGTGLRIKPDRENQTY